MKQIIMNEKTYVENLLKTDTLPPDLSINKFIVYVAKYCYLNKKTLNETIDYIKWLAVDYDFNPIEYQEYIMVEHVKKYFSGLSSGKIRGLKECDKIPLYKSDFDMINLCENTRQKKMMFTLIVLARFTDQYGWIYSQRSDLYKLANVSSTGKNGSNLIYELLKLNLVKVTKRVDDNKVGVNNLYVPANDEKPVYCVTEINHLGNKYVGYTDPKKKVCEVCGRLIRIKSTGRPSLYCEQCANRINIEKTNENNKEKRKSLKN